MHDLRRPADVHPAIMQAAIEGYEGGDRLTYPLLDYRRLSHAIRSAAAAQAAILAQQMTGPLVSLPDDMG